MRIRLLFAFVLPLASAACSQSGIMVGGPGVQVGIPVRRTAAFGDTVVDRLYFGRSIREGGGTVSDSAWSAFLREVVTGRFPDGLTVYRAEGQWREGDGRILREETFVLEIVHPVGPSAEADFREIAAEYKRRFRQQSVMRVTTPARQRFYD
ncbi:MAG TPA: DUF3574 domain-containing protein [Longimicrobium sp.]|jgi:hypothetical protein|nr:DUF3574 domain-containing protein [Longimicrobium sp.]